MQKMNAIGVNIMHQSKRNNKNNNVQTKIDLTSTWETVARIDKNFNEFAREINTRLDTINIRLDNIVLLITNKGPSAHQSMSQPRINDNAQKLVDEMAAKLMNQITPAQIAKIKTDNIPLPPGKKLEELTKRDAWELIQKFEAAKKEVKQ